MAHLENENQEKKQRRPRKDRDSEVKMERVDEFTDKVVHVNRVSKTVKGGKRFAFAALVVVGDQKGRVGFAHAKAKEVPDAIKKANERARREIVRIPLKEGRTLHHDVIGHFGAGKVTLRMAPAGTGIIAGGPMRAILETMGIQDVVAKCTGSSNPHNMVRATFDALEKLSSPRAIAAKRGKKVGDIVSRRDGVAVAKEAE
ncbi:MAG: 30S ribosomal protein S5 [Alphaproteobacteria bacterium]